MKRFLAGGLKYKAYIPPQEKLLDENGEPVFYEIYSPPNPQLNRIVTHALASEQSLPPEEMAIADALFLLQDMERETDPRTLLGRLALQYFIEREKLPAPNDSKKTLRRKREQRMLRTVGTSAFSVRAAAEFACGKQLMLCHDIGNIERPALLYQSEDRAKNTQEGYTVDYVMLAGQGARRSNTVLEPIAPASFTSQLEIGFELRKKAASTAISYKSLYGIEASQHSHQLRSVSIESLESRGDVSLDEILFAIGVLHASIEAVRKRSPYPEHNTPRHW